MAGEKSSSSSSSRHGQVRERRSSSLFSVLNIFKSGRGRRSGNEEEEEEEEDTRRAEAVNYHHGKIRHSDEDKEHWVADPLIDSKASAFIARFYATRVSESEIQTINVPYHHHNYN